MLMSPQFRPELSPSFRLSSRAGCFSPVVAVVVVVVTDGEAFTPFLVGRHLLKLARPCLVLVAELLFGVAAPLFCCWASRFVCVCGRQEMKFNAIRLSNSQESIRIARNLILSVIVTCGDAAFAFLSFPPALHGNKKKPTKEQENNKSNDSA